MLKNLNAMGELKFELVDCADILEFRHAMLWPDRPLAHVMVSGDEDAVHVCLKHNDQVIAAGSFFIVGSTAQLRKLAVDPDWQGRGLGKSLVTFGAQHIAKLGVSELWCDARATAVGFYEALGFTVARDIYLKSDVAYRKASVSLGPDDELA